MLLKICRVHIRSGKPARSFALVSLIFASHTSGLRDSDLTELSRPLFSLATGNTHRLIEALEAAPFLRNVE